MSKKLALLILLAITASGFYLRLTKLTQIPAGFNWDEAAIGYNAYALLQTGQDEFGRSWPLFIESFGDFKTGLYSILIVPIIRELGLSIFSVRILNVFIGTSAILAAYFMALAWTSNRRAALAAAALMAFSPLTIHLSRFTLEWYAALPLLLWGMGLLVREKNWAKNLPLTASILGFSLYWYHSLRLFLPLLLLAYAVIYRKWLLAHKKQVVIGLAACLLTIAPLLVELSRSQIMARPQAVSIFAGESQQQRQTELTYRSTVLGWPLRQSFANPIVFYSQEVLERYLAHFSADFLFFGEDATPRISIYPLHKLPLVSLPFLLIGIGILLWRRKPSDLLLLAWILLAPLPASLSQDAPHGLRSLPLLPALQLCTVIGLAASYRFARVQLQNKNWQLYSLVAIVALYGALEFNRQMLYYFAFYGEETAHFWQADHDQLVTKIQAYQGLYEQIVLTTHYGQPHIFLAFFTPLDPLDYQAAMRAGTDSFNTRLDHLGKIRFDAPNKTDYCLENTLLINHEPLPVQDLTPLDVIYTANRFHAPKASFYFYDTKQVELQEWCARAPQN